jgi:rhamnosyltransferase
VAAIVVTYRPEWALLRESIEALKAQGAVVVLVDNGDSDAVVRWNHELPDIRADHVESLGSNQGIACAHNAGIEWARQHGFAFVLLMDQDSVAQAGMVQALLHEAARVDKPAAIGPRYVDERQNNPVPFLQIKGLRLFRHTCENAKGALPVDYLISSGSLIPMSTLDVVGGMREDLFIDYVDIEWGLRARHHGFQSYGVCKALMQHSLGENPVKFFKRSIPLHSPLRHYYHFRNAILLYRSGWLPLNWKIVDGWRLLLRYGFYSLYARPRWQHWKMMSLGLFHGLINRSGKYID